MFLGKRRTHLQYHGRSPGRRQRLEAPANYIPDAEVPNHFGDHYFDTAVIGRFAAHPPGWPFPQQPHASGSLGDGYAHGRQAIPKGTNYYNRTNDIVIPLGLHVKYDIDWATVNANKDYLLTSLPTVRITVIQAIGNGELDLNGNIEEQIFDANSDGGYIVPRRLRMPNPGNTEKYNILHDKVHTYDFGGASQYVPIQTGTDPVTFENVQPRGNWTRDSVEFYIPGNELVPLEFNTDIPEAGAGYNFYARQCPILGDIFVMATAGADSTNPAFNAPDIAYLSRLYME